MEKLPFLLINERSPTCCWMVDIESNAFHHIECYIARFQFDTNSKCARLKWNQEIVAMVKRCNSVSKPHTNYKYLSCPELTNQLALMNNTNNELKLSSLNLRKSNFSLRNRLDDYKRFLQLIEQNDIPRLHQLVRTCIKAKRGINGIINK